MIARWDKEQVPIEKWASLKVRMEEVIQHLAWKELQRTDIEKAISEARKRNTGTTPGAVSVHGISELGDVTRFFEGYVDKYREVCEHLS